MAHPRKPGKPLRPTRARKKPPPPPLAAKRGRVPANPNSGAAQQRNIDPDNAAPNYNAQLRERFITEYLRDFNNGNAYLRAAGPEVCDLLAWKTIQNNGWKMRHEPYVAQKIAEALDALEEEHVITRKEILIGLKKEANDDGPNTIQAARVSAWGTLAKVMGMDTKRVEMNLASQGGILIVPQAQGVDDWEKRSQAAQAALKEAVRK